MTYCHMDSFECVPAAAEGTASCDRVAAAVIGSDSNAAAGVVETSEIQK